MELRGIIRAWRHERLNDWKRHPFTIWKEDQKTRVALIKQLKHRHEGHVNPFDEMLGKLRTDYRHCHIAYCEARGRTRGQIERPGKDNLPNEAEIKKFRERIDYELKRWEKERGKS